MRSEKYIPVASPLIDIGSKSADNLNLTMNNSRGKQVSELQMSFYLPISIRTRLEITDEIDTAIVKIIREK